MWHIVKCSLNCLNFIIMSPCCSRSSSCTYVFIFYYSQIVNHLHLHEEVRASCQLGFSIFSYLWCIFMSYMMCMFLLFTTEKEKSVGMIPSLRLECEIWSLVGFRCFTLVLTASESRSQRTVGNNNKSTCACFKCCRNPSVCFLDMDFMYTSNPQLIKSVCFLSPSCRHNFSRLQCGPGHLCVVGTGLPWIPSHCFYPTDKHRSREMNTQSTTWH